MARATRLIMSAVCAAVVAATSLPHECGDGFYAFNETSCQPCPMVSGMPPNARPPACG